jgi:hypothetical protein
MWNLGAAHIHPSRNAQQACHEDQPVQSEVLQVCNGGRHYLGMKTEGVSL